MVVIDASVIIKWFIREDLYDEGQRLLEREDQFAAPDIVVPEVVNILWKKTQRGELVHSEADAILALVLGARLSLIASSELARRSLAIAVSLGHPAYDCLYIACAEAAIVPLVTADRRLLRTVAPTPFAGFVRHLGQAD